MGTPDKQAVTLEAKIEQARTAIANKADTSGFDEAIIYAAQAEQRRRETQGAYTKAQQELINVRKQAEAYKESMVSLTDIEASLSTDELEELEELKLTDPDEWYKKKIALDNKLKAVKKAKVEEVLTKAEQKALEEASKVVNAQSQEQVLAAFKETHPNFVLNYDDIPPKFTNKLNNGDIDYAMFLEEVHKFNSSLTINQEVADAKPNFNLGGGAQPQKAAQDRDIFASYASETY